MQEQEQTQMIGDKEEENKLEQLIEQAKQDPAIQKAITGESKEKKEAATTKQYEFDSDGLKFKSCNKANALLNSIDTNFSFVARSGEGFLLKDKSDVALSTDNALLALAYSAADGKKRMTNELLAGIEILIGFDEETGLIKDLSSVKNRKCGGVSARSNAALALTYLITGKEEEGKKLIKSIEEHFGFDKKTGLVNSDKDDNPDLWTYDSILMSLAYLAAGREEKGYKLIENIEKHIGFNEEIGLVNNGWRWDIEDDSLELELAGVSRTDAALAIAYFAYGRKKDALKLIENIEKHYKFDEKSGLIEHSNVCDEYNIDNNATLALAYMVKEYYKDKFNPPPPFI